MTPEEAYCKAKKLGKITPKLEPAISKDAYCSYYYARNMIKDRFILAEPTISKDTAYGYYYARDIIKGKFSLAEPTIGENTYFSYWYARNVIKGRFELGELAISKNAVYSYLYAKHVIKGRLPDFIHNQMILNNDEYTKDYIEFISKNPDSQNNKM